MKQQDLCSMEETPREKSSGKEICCTRVDWNSRAETWIKATTKVPHKKLFSLTASEMKNKSGQLHNRRCWMVTCSGGHRRPRHFNGAKCQGRIAPRERHRLAEAGWKI